MPNKIEVTWVPIHELKQNPKNPNKHSIADIDYWVKILDYQGWRLPIVVNIDTGYMQAGHGRLMAAKKRGDTEVPVSYQTFDSEEQAYAFMVSDNAMAQRSELDLSMINNDIPDLGPDFEIPLLGIPDFELEPADKYENEGSTKKAGSEKICPNCGEKF